MTDQQWQLAWSLYRQISDSDSPVRGSVASKITDDPEVLQEVVMLLHSSGVSIGQPGTSLPEPLQLGTKIGRFTVTGLVGDGSFGRVYAARDLELNRPVALKVLHHAGERSHSRSFREARAASALNHPGIVTIYEVIRTDSCFAIAMELVEGETLRSRLARPLSISEICQFGTQIARALAVSNAAGIIHGDLKPENIMLRQDGYVKVLDFGLAQDLSTTSEPAFHLAGTLSYMAPELFAGRSVSSASDCYALGIVLAEMTADADQSAARVPSALKVLIESVITDEPERRPQPNEVAEKLAQIALPPTRGKRVTRLLLWLPAAAAAMLVLIFFWAINHRKADIHPELSSPDQVQQAENRMKPAAYSLYLQAHFAEQQHTPEQTLKAIQLYQDAVRVDPASGELHFRLAGEYLLTLEFGLLPVDEVRRRAEAEAQTAFRLGSDGAPIILAQLKEACGDWIGAEAEFKKGRRPNALYSLMLSMLGRADEAMSELDQVRKKQPWALDYMTQVGTELYLARHYEPAIAQEKNVLAIEPRFYAAAAWLTEILLAAHRPEEALAVFNRYLTPVENTTYFEAIHVYCYAATGAWADAKRLLAIMSAPQKGTYVAPVDLAVAYIGAGDFTKAAENLEKAYTLHDAGLSSLKADPLFDPMRADPRFQKVLAEMNFPR